MAKRTKAVAKRKAQAQPQTVSFQYPDIATYLDADLKATLEAARTAVVYRLCLDIQTMREYVRARLRAEANGTALAAEIAKQLPLKIQERQQAMVS